MYTVKEKKSKKLSYSLAFAAIASMIWVGYANFDLLLRNRSLSDSTIEYVMYANNPDTVLLHTFKHPVYGNAKLYAGTEDNTGLRHILAVHTEKYFINYSAKNEQTLFADDVEGVDILKGLENFFKHCIKVDVYNRKRNENTTYIGFAEIRGVPTRCLLAVETRTGKILTFYPLNDIQESDLTRWNLRLD